MENLLPEIRKTLTLNVDEKTLLTGKRYFKEEVTLYGVRIPVVNKISKEFYSLLKDQSKQEIFSLCEALWKSGYNEEACIACNWSYYLHKQYEPSDLLIFEKWIEQYVKNWASCDTLCNHSVGTLLEMYPEKISLLKKWAASDNRWMKRAAAVSLIIPARKGMFLEDIFEIATILLYDKDDLVQKGYGWMLKAASESHEDEVYEFVFSKKQVMPRTSLRYAIEKMSEKHKKEAMKK